jgi:site-specific DNA recombinase
MLKSKSHTTQRQDAVKYGRVSSKEQEKEGFSVPAQFKLLDQYAKAQGLKIVREFVDVETAKKPGRAGFDEMVKLLKRSSVRVLLVEKTDRLYRNLKDYVTWTSLHIAPPEHGPEESLLTFCAKPRKAADMSSLLHYL